ncbi:MFS transporter [Rhodovarius crocodyli]|uniref:MFS transporter n=2 Tax=Rhodovarius crocodyli TaxID=1979269 RepID=A0A437MK22_9PROT|nr:MFS transporter [Rhodovarius crocodyli]
MRKVMLRIVPFLILCYIISYLDRVNVGFAALTMNRDLGFSAAVYGLGAGIFFVTYFLFEVPSNLALHRFGARMWIARIMVTWGVLSGAMGFIPQISAATGLSYEAVFYTIRLLLGAAEAGFFPGVIFYLTLWFPSAYRARVVGYFMTALPLASVIGAPLSGYLLGLDGFHGMAGWQWMFIIEAIPAVILAAIVLGYLTDKPGQAKWLEPAERDWLAARLAQEERERAGVATHSPLAALANPLVLALGFVYFGVVAMNYTVGFFLPSIIREFGLSNLQTGFVAAIPSLVGAISMVVWGRRSDAAGERKWHLVFALAVGACSFAAAAVIQEPVLKILCFAIAAFGIYGSQPVFWTLPGSFLSGAAAAAGIAVINSLANLSGFAGPYVMGWIKTSTGDFTGGLLLVACVAGLATLVVAMIGRQHFPQRAPQGEARPQAAE